MVSNARVMDGSFLPLSYRNPAASSEVIPSSSSSLGGHPGLVRQPSVSSLSTGKKKTRGVRRSVSFNTAGPAIQRIDSVKSLLLDDDDMDDDEKKKLNEIWYDQVEIESAKYEHAHLVEAVQGLSEDDLEQQLGDSFRGLESKTEQGSWAAFQNRAKALGAVLDSTSHVNADELASLASEATEEARLVAQQRALQDAKEAQEYLSDVRDLLFHQNCNNISLDVNSAHSLPARPSYEDDDSDSDESITSEFTTDTDLNDKDNHTHPPPRRISTTSTKSNSKTPIQRSISMPMPTPAETTKTTSTPPAVVAVATTTTTHKPARAFPLAESVKKLKQAKLMLQQQQQQQACSTKSLLSEASTVTTASGVGSNNNNNNNKERRSLALKSRIIQMNETAAQAPPSMFANSMIKKKKNILPTNVTRTKSLPLGATRESFAADAAAATTATTTTPATTATKLDDNDKNQKTRRPLPDHDWAALGKSDSCLFKKKTTVQEKERRPSSSNNNSIKSQIMKMNEKPQPPPFGATKKSIPPKSKSLNGVTTTTTTTTSSNNGDDNHKNPASSVPDHRWEVADTSLDNSEKKERRPSKIKDQILKMNEKPQPPPFQASSTSTSTTKVSKEDKPKSTVTSAKKSNDAHNASGSMDNSSDMGGSSSQSSGVKARIRDMNEAPSHAPPSMFAINLAKKKTKKPTTTTTSAEEFDINHASCPALSLYQWKDHATDQHLCDGNLSDLDKDNQDDEKEYKWEKHSSTKIVDEQSKSQSEKKTSTITSTAKDDMYQWKDHSKVSEQNVPGGESPKPDHWTESLKKKEEAKILAKKAKLEAYAARTQGDKEDPAPKTGPDDSYINVDRDALPKKKSKLGRSSSLGGKKGAANALKALEEASAAATAKAKAKPRRCESFGGKEKISKGLDSL